MFKIFPFFTIQKSSEERCCIFGKLKKHRNHILIQFNILLPRKDFSEEIFFV